MSIHEVRNTYCNSKLNKCNNSDSFVETYIWSVLMANRGLVPHCRWFCTVNIITLNSTKDAVKFVKVRNIHAFHTIQWASSESEAKRLIVEKIYDTGNLLNYKLSSTDTGTCTCTWIFMQEMSTALFCKLQNVLNSPLQVYIFWSTPQK